jgi:hypothetical protein
LHRRSKPKRRLRKSRSSSVDELAAVIAYGVVLNQLSWNWRECWQPAGSHASHWVARVGQARRCEASAWMSRRPSSWSKLSTIVERPGQPVALIPRKRGISCVRASVLPSLKNRDTFADTSRATLSCTGGEDRRLRHRIFNRGALGRAIATLSAGHGVACRSVTTSPSMVTTSCLSSTGGWPIQPVRVYVGSK